MQGLIRQRLLSDLDLVELLNEKEAIFYIEKPDEEDFKDWNPFVIFKSKIVSGDYVKDYLVEFNIVGKDLNIVINIEKKLIEILDDTRNTNIIKDENNTIHSIRLANGGGIVKNPETENYHSILFFIARI